MKSNLSLHEPRVNTFLYGIYCLLTSGLFFLLLPVFGIYTGLTRRHRKGFAERLGFIPLHIRQRLSGPARIWVHAASLGEVRVANSIIRALKRFAPEGTILLSTTTEHGHDLALELLGESVPVILAPLDFIGSVKVALTRVRPDVMVFLETEIWPAWISEAKRRGSKVVLLNGRISGRSVGWYLKFRSFFRDVLGKVDFFSMISKEDAERIRSMGAQPDKIRVQGNAKYDLLSDSTSEEKQAEMREIYKPPAGTPVIIAGSTRSGEESLLLKAFRQILTRYPRALLIMAPRHLNRVPEIEYVIKSRGFGYQLRSTFDGIARKREEQVVIVDKFGELFSLYSIGDINFCGASLIPLGGQNPFEPAVWGKAVFYGPYMDDFLDAKFLLESAGAGIVVDNEEVLAEKAIWYLDHPEILKKTGAKAREAVLLNGNAAERHARVVIDFLNEPFRR